MIVSVTERSVFRRCRRRWDYSSTNRRGLVRVGPTAKALELGSLIHKALGEWSLHEELDPVELFMTFATQRMDEIDSAYRLTVGAAPSTEEFGPLLDIITLGRAMVSNYKKFYGSPLPPNMRFASIEQQVEVPIPGTNGEHVLKASFDGLLQDDKNRLFVLERKTFSRRPALDSLHRNDQFTAYTWAARELGIGPVHGVAYDGLLKKAKLPRNSTDPADLFLRTTIRKPPEELEVFEQNLIGEVRDMANPDLVLYPNVPWKGCDDCSFGDLCTAQSRGEPIDDLIRLLYTKRQADNAGYVSASVGGIRTYGDYDE